MGRIVCAALSVAITCWAMVIFNVGHPPAGATTLIVSLGLITTPTNLCCMMGAVSLLTVKVGQAEESLDTKLENEMRRLSTDNFGKAFDLCTKAQDYKAMEKLLQFLAENKSTLLSNDSVPFAVRVMMSNGSATIQV